MRSRKLIYALCVARQIEAIFIGIFFSSFAGTFRMSIGVYFPAAKKPVLMCTYTMESIVDPCESMDGPESEADWLNKYVETENVFLDYLKCLTFTSPSNVDTTESILPEYDGTENGFEALDNLCDLLVTLCDGGLSRHESVDSSSTVQSQDTDKKKQEPRNKRSSKCLSSLYGKELQVG